MVPWYTHVTFNPFADVAVPRRVLSDRGTCNACPDCVKGLLTVPLAALLSCVLALDCMEVGLVEARGELSTEDDCDWHGRGDDWKASCPNLEERDGESDNEVGDTRCASGRRMCNPLARSTMAADADT